MSKNASFALVVAIVAAGVGYGVYRWADAAYLTPMKLDAVFEQKTITTYQNGREQHMPLGEFIAFYDPEKKQLLVGGLNREATELGLASNWTKCKVLEAMPPKYKVRYLEKATFLVDTLSETVEPVDDTARKIIAAEGSNFTSSSNHR